MTTLTNLNPDRKYVGDVNVFNDGDVARFEIPVARLQVAGAPKTQIVFEIDRKVLRKLLKKENADV